MTLPYQKMTRNTMFYNNLKCDTSGIVYNGPYLKNYSLPSIAGSIFFRFYQLLLSGNCTDVSRSVCLGSFLTWRYVSSASHTHAEWEDRNACCHHCRGL